MFLLFISSVSPAYNLSNPSPSSVKQHGASSENSDTEPVSRWRWFSCVRAVSTFPAVDTPIVTEIFLPWPVVRWTRHPELSRADQESLVIAENKNHLLLKFYSSVGHPTQWGYEVNHRCLVTVYHKRGRSKLKSSWLLSNVGYLTNFFGFFITTDSVLCQEKF